MQQKSKYFETLHLFGVFALFQYIIISVILPGVVYEALSCIHKSFSVNVLKIWEQT